MSSRFAAILTIIEVIVLVVWLGLARGNVSLGIERAAPVAAAGFLVIGILVEELVRYRLLKGVFPASRALKLVALGVVIETVGWIVAVPREGLVSIYAAMQSVFAGMFVILFAFLAVEHAVIDVATRGVGLRQLRLGQVLGFSAVEAAGGAIWLFNPVIGTIIVLAATSFFEHRDGIALSRR